MKIDKEKCMSCGNCLPVCPMGAILLTEEGAEIDHDECVECGACYRSGICPMDAFVQEAFGWPRVIRSMFSDPLSVHELTGIPGRGTTEMKTNDVTNRFRKGEAGLGLELGRPGIGTRLSEVEKLTIPLCRIKDVDWEFQQNNPISQMIDTKTGRFHDRRVVNEKVLSAIIEIKVKEAEAFKLLAVIREACRTLSNVCSVEYITRNIENNMISNCIVILLKQSEFDFRPNGKICLGFGRAKGGKN
jgi:NAD-dependent dihydropyrimidine dehydrogenase PreA subunit